MAHLSAIAFAVRQSLSAQGITLTAGHAQQLAAAAADVEATAPDIQDHGFPQPGFGRAVGCIDDTVHYVAVIEVFSGFAFSFYGIEHIGKHMIVAQFVHLITDREKPPA